jgi:hypothetical protein
MHTKSLHITTHTRLVLNMNALDTKITELFTVVAYKKNWGDSKTFQNYVELRDLIDRGIYTRSLVIWLLKKAVA